MRSQVLAGAVLAVVTTATLLATPDASAAQHWARLAVSRNGQVWTSDITHPLFGRHIRFVPGDQADRRFYVRNQSGERARLSVGVKVSEPDAWFDSRKVRMYVRARGAWHQVRRTGGQKMTAFVIRAGDVAPVTVRVRLLPTSGKHTMNQSLTFSVNLRLSPLIHGGRPA